MGARGRFEPPSGADVTSTGHYGACANCGSLVEPGVRICGACGDVRGRSATWAVRVVGVALACVAVAVLVLLGLH